jgi:adenylate kinase
MNRLAITLIGVAGAGKGTLSKWLLKRYPSWGHLSSGDRFRGLIDNSPDGKLVGYLLRFVPRGRLVPDPLVMELAEGWLSEPNFSDAVVLDGLPRTRQQCEVLYGQVLPRRGFDIGPIIHIEVTEKDIRERLKHRKVCTKCGAIWNDLLNASAVPNVCDYCHAPLTRRTDDHPDILNRRLALHFRHVPRVLEVLGDKVVTVPYPNTMRNVAELFAKVSAAAGFKDLPLSA